MDVADVTAAEGEAQALDDGAARLQAGFGRVDEGALPAGDDLDGFHVAVAPAEFWRTGEEYSSFAAMAGDPMARPYS